VPVTESVTVPGYTATLTRNVSHSTGRLDSFVVSDDGTSTTLSQGLAPSVRIPPIVIAAIAAS
jgi:hypothetical protein